MLLQARRYDSGEAVAVELHGERIAEIRPLPTPADSLPFVAPGLVDLQVNGHGGQEFNDLELTVEHVGAISRAMDRDGVTTYLPTATTHSHEMLRHAMATVAAACEQDADVRARVPGIHLEGPFLSAEDGPRGAHPRPHIRPPDWDEFQRLQDAAGGRIKILTLAPEHDGAAEFIRRVVDQGVVVAIGHTAADSDQIRAAVDAGASMSTHLGNGAHGMIRRHPNYIWDQLADDRLTASLIADGHHLPAAVVQSFVRGKTPERCVLVSDITGMGGMPPGRYDNASLGGVEVLDDGRLVIAGQRQLLAGAALPLAVGIGNVMRMAGVSLAEAIRMSSQRPARLIGLEPVELTVGAVADLFLFDIDEHGAVAVRGTLKRGQWTVPPMD